MGSVSVTQQAVTVKWALGLAKAACKVIVPYACMLSSDTTRKGMH